MFNTCTYFNYGDAFTALTKVIPIQCGQTISSITDLIEAIPIINATQYEFEVTVPEVGTVVIPSSNNILDLYNNVPGSYGGIQYNTGYTIRVRYKKANTGFTDWGDACIVTTPSASVLYYTFDNSIISNPERGFSVLTTTGTSGGYNLLTPSELTGYRAENITTIQRQFFLLPFIDGTPITQTYLDNMQTDFNRIRTAGLKVLARFTYTSLTATVYQPTKAQIISHIGQLTSVINANKDIISSIQVGFIGRYGEWFYTGSSEFGDGDYNLWTETQLDNRKEVLDSVLTQFDSSIPIQLRTVFYKQMLYPLGNSRIGFYNDAFLNNYGDKGTFNVSSAGGTPNSTQIEIFQTASSNSPITGESNGLNVTDSYRTDGWNAIIELNDYNWSLINKSWHPDVIASWISSGDYDTISKNLGYRFVLNSSAFSRNGNTLNVNLNISNVGYANSFRSRNAYIVFKNVSSGTTYQFQITTDVNTWNDTFILNEFFDISSLPSGTYNSYLHIPDPNPSISSNPLYSIRLSNTGIWEEATGYNNLNQTFTK